MKKILLIIILNFLLFDLLYGDTEVPIVNQIQILQKILSVEKKISASTSKEIMIGVIFQADNKGSNETKKEIVNFVQNKVLKVGTKTLKFVLINISASNSDNIISTITSASNKLDVLIITQLRNVNYNNIRLFAVDNNILTYSTNSNIMENYKFSLSVGYKSNNVQPFVNSKQVNSEGFSLPSSFLEYARIIK